MNVTLDAPSVNTNGGLNIPAAPAPLVYAVEYRAGLLFPLRPGAYYPCWYRPVLGTDADNNDRVVYGPFVACADETAARVVERKLVRGFIEPAESLAAIIETPQGELLSKAGFADLIAANHLALLSTRVGGAEFAEWYSVETWLSQTPGGNSGSALLAIDLSSSRVRVRHGMGARN